MMAEVEWVQRSTGAIQKGDENLYKLSSGWMPVAWLEYRGNLYRSTLADMAKALLRHSTIIVKELADGPSNTIRGLTLTHQNEYNNIEIISDILNHWWNVSIKFEIADVVEVAYQEVITWPPKEDRKSVV